MPYGTMATETHQLGGHPSLLRSPQNERRPDPRAELTLPVRLRWLGPFGLETEITQSWNVSRSGMLAGSSQPRYKGSLVWVTFPCCEDMGLAEPETRARVARCQIGPGGIQMIGMAFDSPRRAGGNEYHRIPRGVTSVSAPDTRKYFEIGDRRRRTRYTLALFVRVSRIKSPGSSEFPAHQDPPWPEETMTMNLSPGGVLFCSLRIHEVGDRLTFTFAKGAILPQAERLGRVVHVAPLDAESPLLCVGVEFFSFKTRKS